jgi:hypothetical protein
MKLHREHVDVDEETAEGFQGHLDGEMKEEQPEALK